MPTTSAGMTQVDDVPLLCPRQEWAALWLTKNLGFAPLDEKGRAQVGQKARAAFGMQTKAQELLKEISDFCRASGLAGN